MKIVHLLRSCKFSGAENVVCQIIQLFQDEPNVEMIYISPDGPIRDALAERQIRFYPLKSFNQRYINEALAYLKPDIIHAHDFNASVRASMCKKVRIVSHLHNNPPWIKRICIRSILYRACLNKFETVIGVSSAIYKEFVFRNTMKERFLCLPNVVNANMVLAKSREKVIDNIDILFVGRLTPPKNPIRFLEIVKDVISKYKSNIKVCMVGEGELRPECKKMIDAYNINEQVKMLGFDPNPYKYMLAAKIIIMPSQWEGFGLVAVEAMILGRVVLASPVGGLSDIICDECGELCDSNEDFVNKAIFYLENENERYIVGNRAIQESKKYTDTTQYKARIKGIYFGGR